MPTATPTTLMAINVAMSGRRAKQPMLKEPKTNVALIWLTAALKAKKPV